MTVCMCIELYVLLPLWRNKTTIIIIIILRLRIGARLTRYRNCKFHNGCRTISRHADGISRYSVPPSAGPLLPLSTSALLCVSCVSQMTSIQRLTRLYVFCLVCDSATNDNCSPRWIVHHQSRGEAPRGTASHIPLATSPQLCLEACASDTTCILAHWTRRYEVCYLFYWRSRRRWYLSHVTQFEIVRQCDNSSGT